MLTEQRSATAGTAGSYVHSHRSRFHLARRTMFVLTVLFVSVAQGLLAATITLSGTDALLGFVVATVLATCGIALAFAAGLQGT